MLVPLVKFRNGVWDRASLGSGVLFRFLFRVGFEAPEPRGGLKCVAG